MAADCIVTPRALSAGKKSVTVEPSSTSVGLVRIRHLEGLILKYRSIKSGECAGIGILEIEMASQKKGHTSYPPCMPAIVEHALSGSCLTLGLDELSRQRTCQFLTYRIDVGNNANIPRP